MIRWLILLNKSLGKWSGQAGQHFHLNKSLKRFGRKRFNWRIELWGYTFLSASPVISLYAWPLFDLLTLPLYTQFETTQWSVLNGAATNTNHRLQRFFFSENESTQNVNPGYATGFIEGLQIKWTLTGPQPQNLQCYGVIKDVKVWAQLTALRGQWFMY